jgi:DNA-binding LacI/PurR family transcriptional regulator
VSTATVSRVLTGVLETRPETRDRVLLAVRELGYRPSGIARSLKLGTTGTLGLLVTDILNPFYPELVRAIEDAARDRGLGVLLGNGDEDPEREAAYLELLAERRVDGIIVASSGLSDRHGRWLAAAPVPVVLANCELADGSRPAVLTDSRAATRLATEHLFGLGHREIGHITGRSVDAATDARIGGVRDAMAAAGLPPDALRAVAGDGHVAGGERAMNALLDGPRPPTAVVCYNDLSAIGAIRAVHAHGRRVPQDISIVGFDDIDLAAYVDPPLTTLAQSTTEIGRVAVEWIAALLADDGRPGPPDPGQGHSLRLPAELRVRGSTGPPPT